MTLYPPSFFVLIIRRPPTSPLFPYTTLFRSVDSALATLHANRRAPPVVAPPFEIVARRASDAAVGRQTLVVRSEEHTSELQSRLHLVCRLLLEKKKKTQYECGGGESSRVCHT